MTKLLIASVIFLLAAIGLLLFKRGQEGNQASDTINNIKPLVNDESGIEVEVTPVNLSPAGTDFTVRLTTHSGSLDFDLTKQAVLKAGPGNLLPISWDGGSGGHHLYGTLKFPPVAKDTKSIKLVVSGIGAPERIFEWNI